MDAGTDAATSGPTRALPTLIEISTMRAVAPTSTGSVPMTSLVLGALGSTLRMAGLESTAATAGADGGFMAYIFTGATVAISISGFGA